MGSSSMWVNISESFKVCLILHKKKIVLHLSRKFDKLEPGSSIQSIRRFDLAFWLTSKKFTDKFIMGMELSESFKVCLAFPKKKFIFVYKIWIF